MAEKKYPTSAGAQQYLEDLVAKLQAVAADEFDLAITIRATPKNAPQPRAFGTRSCGGTCDSCWTCGDSCPSWC